MPSETAMLVLEASDLELTLSRDGQVLYAEPGAALAMPKRVLFGREALAQARLHPRQFHNEFWHKLNGDAVAPPGPGIANQADLVYLQLAAMRAAAGLRGRAELVVAAPSAARESQLALLLGIAAQAGFDIRAVVDAGVAAASMHAGLAGTKLVDVGLQQAAVTDLVLGSGSGGAAQLRRQAVREVPAAGFAKLLEGWVDAVADRLVDATRFDPLRLAATEQQVFDQVHAGVAAALDAIAIEVRHEQHVRQIEVQRSALAQKSAQRYDLLLDAVGGASAVALTHRASQLPGLAERLAAGGHRVMPLPADAVARAIAAHAAVLPVAAPGGGAQLVTAWPARGAAVPEAPPTPTPPTHLLCGGLAVPLAALGDAAEHPRCDSAGPLFRLRRQDGGLWVLATGDADIAVNGERLARPRPVAAGDELRCRGAAFALIAVAAGPA